MRLAYFFAALMMLCGLWNNVASFRIYLDLRRRGERVYFLLLQMLGPFYARRYGRITRQETGRPGPLFYPWIASISATAAFAVVTVVLLARS
jgi:hypothetical protein